MRSRLLGIVSNLAGRSTGVCVGNPKRANREGNGGQGCMMEFGYGMQGIEDRVITLAHTMATKFKEVTYVEIGVGEGPTLTAIASELRNHAKQWRAIGVELPNGYSFNQQKV